MTQKSPFDPQDHTYNNSIQQNYNEKPEIAYRNTGKASHACYAPLNKWQQEPCINKRKNGKSS